MSPDDDPPDVFCLRSLHRVSLLEFISHLVCNSFWETVWSEVGLVVTTIYAFGLHVTPVDVTVVWGSGRVESGSSCGT